MYDVIIVGARCAGASLAVFLGQLDYRVLLIDKYRLPGPTLSTHILGEIDVYDRMGILEQMESAGAPAVTRMRVDLEGTVFEADLVVTPRVLGLRRELLDPMLLEAARAKPSVDVQLEAHVREVLFDDNQRVIGLQYQQKDGQSAECYGRVIIGADGRQSSVALQVGAATTRYSEHEHGVFYFYASGIEPLPIPTLEWYWCGDGIVLVNPIDDSRHCVAFMIPSTKLKSWQTDVEAHARAYLQQLRTFVPRLKKLKVNGQIRGIRHIPSFMKQSFGNGWALVGDASAHLHPVSGVGIDNAVCCAEWLAESLHHYLSGETEWDQALARYESARDERIVPQFEAVSKTLTQACEEVDQESLSTLKMLCTFPSVVKKMGRRADDIFSLLS